MARYQRLIEAALLRSSRRLTSPVSVRTFSSSSSILIPKATNLSRLRSRPFFSSISTFSSSSSSPSTRPPRTTNRDGNKEDTFDYKIIDDVEVVDEWEEEEDVEPKLGDGGDGGGVVLGGVSWGERALSIADELVKQSAEDFQLFAFRASPRGYIYVRLDNLSKKFGCPTMDELVEFSREYKKRLDDAGDAKLLPEDLALEVSSPGAKRLLRIPEDLHRFKEMPMRVSYEEETNSRKAIKNAVFLLESVDAESENCIRGISSTSANDNQNCLSVVKTPLQKETSQFLQKQNETGPRKQSPIVMTKPTFSSKAETSQQRSVTDCCRDLSSRLYKDKRAMTQAGKGKEIVTANRFGILNLMAED